MTSCSMSLSLETMTTSKPGSSARRAMVPMTSSASKPRISESGSASLRASRRTYGIWSSRSGGVSVRLALYSANSCVAMRGLAALEDRRDVRRACTLRQLPQHVVEDVDGLGGEAGGGAHGRRAAAGAGMIGAEDEPERVDQEQAGPGHCLMLTTRCKRVVLRLRYTKHDSVARFSHSPEPAKCG